jgi:predicted PurR-regulated permease PerM
VARQPQTPAVAASTLVFAAFLLLLGAFVVAAIPPLAQQATQLASQAPHYIQLAQDRSSAIGKLNERFHLQQRITDTINGSGGSMLNDVITAGTAVFSAVADSVIVVVLTVYFLVDMPRIRATM